MIALVRRGEIRSLGFPVLVLALISFVSQVGIAVMLPLLPLYALSLGAEPFELGLLTSAFALATAVSQLGSGLILDRAGPRAFIRTGTAVYAAANALIATATNATMLIGYRVLAGLGAGANLVATRLYVSQTADPARLAFTQGILSAAASAGSVAGPAIGGLAALRDLRFPFLLVALTSGVAFVATLALPLPRSRPSAGPIDDTTVSALNRAVVALFASQFLLLWSYGAFITTYAALGTELLGWSTLEVGLVFTVFAIGDIMLGPPVSHIADRFGRRRVAVASLATIGVWNVVFVLGLPREVLYAVSLAGGAALTGYGASWFALLTVASPEGRRGRVFGVVSALSQAGVVLGALVASTIWQQAGLRPALSSATVAVALAIVPLLSLPSARRAG